MLCSFQVRSLKDAVIVVYLNFVIHISKNFPSQYGFQKEKIKFKKNIYIYLQKSVSKLIDFIYDCI